MKIDKTVKSETVYIALGQLILSALMLSVYLIIKKFSMPVLFGCLISSVVAVANFLIMGITVQRTLSLSDEKNQKLSMKASQSLRTILMFAVIVVGITVLKLDTIAMIIPLLFPRISIMLRFIKMNVKNQNTDANNSSENNERQ